MKSKITLLLAIVVLASCSAPKYAYYFDHQDYNAGRKAKGPVQEKVSPLAVDPQALVASTNDTPVTTAAPAAVEPVAVKKVTYMQMTKTERKALRKELGKQVKSYIAAKKNMNSVKASQASTMDHDLKLAIIFGAVGLVGLIIGGDVFWIIGGIAMLIGVVFFVKWIIRQ
jgi:uncharacterized membrane protein